MFVEGDFVDTYTLILGLEEQDQQIIRFEPCCSVSSVHAHSIDQVIAVSFNDNLAILASSFTEERPQSRLSAWMEVYLRLLDQELLITEFGE